MKKSRTFFNIEIRLILTNFQIIILILNMTPSTPIMQYNNSF